MEIGPAYNKRDWSTYKERLESLFMPQLEDTLNVKKNKRSSLRYTMNCYSDATSACLCDRIDIAKQLSEVGKSYAEIAIDKKLKKATMGKYVSEELAKYLAYLCLYHHDYRVNKVEDMVILRETVEAIRVVADQDYEKKRGYKGSTMDVVTYATKLGDFELANRYLDRIFKRKKKQKLEVDIVYDIKLFYSYLLEYLKGDRTDNELKESLSKCFYYFSDELLIKQNEKLGAMYKRDEDQIEMMYLWYKYFSEEPFETISPVQIIQSIRSGIK